MRADWLIFAALSAWHSWHQEAAFKSLLSSTITHLTFPPVSGASPFGQPSSLPLSTYPLHPSLKCDNTWFCLDLDHNWDNYHHACQYRWIAGACVSCFLDIWLFKLSTNYLLWSSFDLKLGLILDCKTVVFFPFRKARSVVSVILACEAREPHTPVGRPSPFSFAVSTLTPDLSFEYLPRRLRSQKIRLFCSVV